MDVGKEFLQQLISVQNAEKENLRQLIEEDQLMEKVDFGYFLQLALSS
jgi:hypothetical protein